MRKALILAALVLTAAQTPRPAYDVTSVKLNTSGTFLVKMMTPPGRFSATNVTLKMVLRLAFGNPPDFRMIGLPNWADTDRFDIEASGGPTNGTFSLEQSRLMIRSLLEDRFKLKTHTEKRELPIYNLVLARRDGKLGDQIKPSTSECKEIIPPPGAPPPPPH